ncbi:hypothetical protein BN946_scf184836.g34 [Trametes cinnabarina]|uniref:Meiotically up-regulated protein Msb1/Mug8 domain-containing protein n=1 Tax=Pycnoporus cinnabarinus TaxID=5643 RepID=A0A060S6H6_PYCCI|nr:hypothetical protein BN946_scf184836.g34 [Trametes cinnabarina]
MAAFLSKVFPRKKDKDTNKRSSVSSLLEGKFEAVSPTVSPSAAKFEESAQKPKDRGREKEKEKEKDVGFSLFRSKSRPLSPVPDTRQTVPDVPRLTLNLPVPKEERSRALGVVFEADPNDEGLLPDDVIGERRLNPLEALLLVKACSSAIVANGGLETLGVMHPFWYSASPEVQRKLISLFILSLGPKSPISTLSPSPTSALSTFDTELEYTRSPHDIAAVLRWALRHLRLEGESFGRPNGQWKWYQTFAEAERASSYPMNAFSDALVPQLPPSHLQLLIATLDIVSSLAAHSEHNGISGSKLSKFFGLWLLTTKRSEQDDDWFSFYSRWERAGRILEHIFLAHTRDEMARKKMPLRLAELVRGYPFKGPSEPVAGDAELLPRPRLSTRQYDALYIRIDTQVPDAKSIKRKQHALRLISDALKSELAHTDSKYKDLWEAIRKAALANDEPEPILIHVDGYPSISRIFSDETLRFLSLIPAESSNKGISSVPTIRAPRPPRKRSSSQNLSAKANGNGKAPTNGSPADRSAASPASPSSPKDWMDFSTAGFGESAIGKDFASTLLDKDVEVTTPPVERKSSKKRKASPGRSRGSSVDNPATEPMHRVTNANGPAPPKSKSTVVDLVKLDEAFIDFWSDALLDPISADWPNFVVAQLKSLPGVELDGKPVNWLVLEQRFVAPPPPPPPPVPEADATAPKRASSPRPSMRSEMSGRRSSTLAAAKKRLTFFSSSHTLSGASSVAKAESKTFARKKAKPTRIGELGEILPEEDAATVKKEESKEKRADKEAKTVAEAASQKGPSPSEALKGPEPVADQPKEVHVAIAESPAPAPASLVSSATAATPVTPTTDAMSPLTPTADDFPPVPVVGSLASASAAPSAAADAPAPAKVEPMKTEDAETEDKPVLAAPQDAHVPADVVPASGTTDTAPAEADITQEKVLPPAPEPVILTGETPGPQVALDTSEPAARAEISSKIDEIVAQAGSSPEVDQIPGADASASEKQQTTEVVPETALIEEVVPFATHAEAQAAVEEAAVQQEESPTVAAAAEEAGISPAAAVAATEEPSAAPEPVPEANAPGEDDAPVERPAAEKLVEHAPVPIPEEPDVAPAVSRSQLTAEEPTPAAEPAAPIPEVMSVEAAAQAEPSVPSEPALGPEPEPAEEEIVAPVESTPIPESAPAAEPAVLAEQPVVPEAPEAEQPSALVEPTETEAPLAPAEPALQAEAPKEQDADVPDIHDTQDEEEGAVGEEIAIVPTEDVIVQPAAEDASAAALPEAPAVATGSVEESSALAKDPVDVSSSERAQTTVEELTAEREPTASQGVEVKEGETAETKPEGDPVAEGETASADKVDA